MTELRLFLECLQAKHSIEDPDFNLQIMRFMADNKWFGNDPIRKDGKVCLEDFSPFAAQRIDDFCGRFGKTLAEKNRSLFDQLAKAVPETTIWLQEFIEQFEVDEDAINGVVSFLLRTIPGELRTCTDKEIEEVVAEASNSIPRIFGEILCMFFNWATDEKETVYRRLYNMTARSKNQDNDAYTFEEFSRIAYHLFNQEYIEENSMYQSAAESKNYVDCWLFLCLHFICALRRTDMARIPHPILPTKPEEVLRSVSEGKFTDEDAKVILYSIYTQMNALLLTPNKTSDFSGIGSLKFHVPDSTETHMGTLFAIAEAFFQLSCKSPDEPLIRFFSAYKDITKCMGEEIGDLFFEKDFHSRQTNKAYLQLISSMADTLQTSDGMGTNGYMLAALARSHKGSYGSFAETTSIYLKDFKMNGYSAEFVAREMMERGVLSAIPGMLLKMISDDDYQRLSVPTQTKAVKQLDMTPAEVENVITVADSVKAESIKLAAQIYESDNKKEAIIQLLHRIGNGTAVSKNNNVYCLLTAMEKPCPYTTSNCIGCEYEIGTKATLFAMAAELKRVKKLFDDETDEMLRAKYRHMMKDQIMPAINELLTCMKQEYGEDKAMEYTRILEKVIYGKKI